MIHFSPSADVSAATSLAPPLPSPQHSSSDTCSEGAVAITSNRMNLYKCNNILRFLKGIHFLKIVIWNSLENMHNNLNDPIE